MVDGPTARALRTLQYLADHPGASAGDLAAELGVSERAARRCVSVLRAADVPVESTRGRHGGYRLGRGVRLPPVTFSVTEALALVMSEHPDSGPLGTALDKVLRALPSAIARPAAALRTTAQYTADREPDPDPGLTGRLVDAVIERHATRLTYQGQRGPVWSGRVDPWAVVVRHRRWYLLCLDHRSEQIRTLRIDRIQQVEVLPERIVVPEDLDAVALLEEHLGAHREHSTSVLFEAPIDRVRPFVSAPMGRLEVVDDDSCRLVGSTSNPAMYAGEWLAWMPLVFRIEGDEALRAAAGDVAAKMARAVE